MLSPHVSNFMFVIYDLSDYTVCVDENGNDIVAQSLNELIDLKETINKNLYKGKEIFIMQQKNKIINSLSCIEGTETEFYSEFKDTLNNFESI